MDRFEKFVLKIAEAGQPDDNFRQACSEDSATFGESECEFIREYVLSRLNESTIIDSDNPIEEAKQIHEKISRIAEFDPGYIRSKIRQWALLTISEAISDFDKDFESDRSLNSKIITTFRNKNNDFYGTLKGIIKLISENEEAIQTVHIGTSMYQFGEAIKSSDEVFIFEEKAKQFINKIRELIKKCKRNFNSQEIGSIIYSLQNLPDSEETRALIDSVSDSMEHNNPQIDSQCVGMSLYGLQNMHKSPEVFRFVKEFDRIIQQGAVQINPQALSNAFFGLQNIINSEELSEIKEKLLAKVQSLNPEEISITTLLSFIRAFKMIGLRVPDQLWTKYIQYINTYEGRAFASDWEKRVFSAIQDRFKYYYGSHNYYVDGFELDVYFREKRINIELDGPHHSLNSTYEEKRDNYLSQRHNITIVRIPYEIIDNEDLIMDLLSPIIKGY